MSTVLAVETWLRRKNYCYWWLVCRLWLNWGDVEDSVHVGHEVGFLGVNIVLAAPSIRPERFVQTSSKISHFISKKSHFNPLHVYLLYLRNKWRQSHLRTKYRENFHWSPALIYRPYIRVPMSQSHHPYIRPVELKSIAWRAFSIRAVYTARIYGWPVHTTRIYTGRLYGPYIYGRKKCKKMRPYIRAVYTGSVHRALDCWLLSLWIVIPWVHRPVRGT